MKIEEKAFNWTDNLTKFNYTSTNLATLIPVEVEGGVLYKIKFSDGTEDMLLHNKTRAVEIINISRHELLQRAGGPPPDLK